MRVAAIVGVLECGSAGVLKISLLHFSITPLSAMLFTLLHTA